MRVHFMFLLDFGEDIHLFVIIFLSFIHAIHHRGNGPADEREVDYSANHNAYADILLSRICPEDIAIANCRHCCN